MFSVVQSLSDIPKVQKCIIDGAVFQLHYVVTVFTLLAFVAILTMREFVGDPVDCIYNDRKTIQQKAMDTYCWTHATFTIPFSANNSNTGHPGIGFDADPSTFRYHTYYQWVYFALSMQAGMFYIPRWLWLQWEGGKVEAMMEGLRVAVLSQEEKNTKKEIVLGYILTAWKKHDWYARRYIICESLTVINVIAQFVLLDFFFQQDFMLLGIRVILYSWNNIGVAPLYELFPRVTMCEFTLSGVSQQPKKEPAMCILPLNVFNEKVYIFQWFWFMILLFVSSVSLAVDITVLTLPKLRAYVMRNSFAFVDAECVEKLAEKGGFGDWFLLYLLGRNMDFVVYKEVIRKLAEMLSDDEGKEV